MRTITSAGGPYIVVDRHSAQYWGANVSKSFSPASSPSPDDYEAIGDLTDGRSNPPCNIAKFAGRYAEALLITMPFEIAIIDNNTSSIYLAQAQYAEQDWSFADVSADTFSAAEFDEVVPFVCKGGVYTVFDSAYLPTEVGEDFLEFELVAGDYVFAAAMYEPDKRTALLLYKIEHRF